jgi:hypothetical protein
VKFRRSVEIDLPNPAPGGAASMRVRAPGNALAALSDTGIWAARVNNWMALGRSPLIDPANAKTRSELVVEITDAIMQTGSEAVFDIDAYLVIADPAEEKISRPLLPGPLARHALVPGVEVSIAAVPHNPSEANQSRLGPTTAGHVRQFALVKVPQTP